MLCVLIQFLSGIVATTNIIILEGRTTDTLSREASILNMSKVGQSIRGICRYSV